MIFLDLATTEKKPFYRLPVFILFSIFFSVEREKEEEENEISICIFRIKTRTQYNSLTY